MQVENSLKDIVSSPFALKNILHACGWNTQGKCPSSLGCVTTILTCSWPHLSGSKSPLLSSATTSSSTRDGGTEVLWSWTCVLCKAALRVWYHLLYGSVLLCPEREREREREKSARYSGEEWEEAHKSPASQENQSQNHRIIESPRLEKTHRITQSNCPPITNTSH